MSVAVLRYSGAIALPVLVASTLLAQEPLSRAEVAKIAKPATVLVEVERGTGSGFCIHPSGYFVTNEHVVRSATQAGKVTLVLDASLKSQKKVEARIVRVDKDLDLALLKAEGDSKFPALTLGSEESLTELAELIAVGFPFGKALDTKRDYPAITINIVNITALRNDGEQELYRIQLDSNLNPGNSGGPVVDRKGKVVGVVVSGISGAGINNAIPIQHLRKFLERPEIAFLPPKLHVTNKHATADFQVMASMLPIDAVPLELELILEIPGRSERRFPMKRAGDTYSVQAVPFPAPEADALVRVEIKFANGSLTASTKDRTFRVGKEKVKLSDVQSMKPGPNAEVVLRTGDTLRGPLAELDAVDVKLGSRSFELKLADVENLQVPPPPPEDMLACTIIAKKAGKVVGRLERVLTVAGSLPAVVSKDDVKRLDGLWLLEIGESNGKFYGPRQGDEAIYIENREILWTNKKGTDRSGPTARLTIDSTKDPKWFDFIMTRGSHNGQRILGIYKFEGDKLIIATSDFEAENRPNQFTTSLAAGVGRAHTVSTYIRVTD